jgi:hypothetical protein
MLRRSSRHWTALRSLSQIRAPQWARPATCRGSRRSEGRQTRGPTCSPDRWTAARWRGSGLPRGPSRTTGCALLARRLLPRILVYRNSCLSVMAFLPSAPSAKMRSQCRPLGVYCVRPGCQNVNSGIIRYRRKVPRCRKIGLGLRPNCDQLMASRVDTVAYADRENHKLVKLVVEFAIPGAPRYHQCEDPGRQRPPDSASKGHRVCFSSGFRLAGET